MDNYTATEQAYKNGYEQGQRDAVKHGRCKFCGGKDNAFHIINAETAAYSGIELAINRQGMLRVRVYDDYESETALPRSSEIIMIANCPNCGCKMDLEEST